MIEINEIFSDSDKRIALWCDVAGDTNDLAMMAENVINENIHVISVSPAMVPLIWPYLEKSGVKILTRYVLNAAKKDMDDEIYKMAENINRVLKQGANGVQIFVNKSELDGFIEHISVVRDDLFFEYDLCVALDIGDINLDDWGHVFQKLRDIRANALCLTLREDMGNRSDFVGRIYGMLQNWDFGGQLHFILNNNYDRMDQVIRLIESEKPDLSDKVRFFLNY